MKLTISGKTFVNDKNKDGTPFISKNGKPYKKIAFKVKEEVLGKVGEYVSGFYRDSMADWGDGTEIEVDVELNGKYLNFSLPKNEVTVEMFNALERRVLALEEMYMMRNEELPVIDQEKPDLPF